MSMTTAAGTAARSRAFSAAAYSASAAAPQRSGVRPRRARCGARLHQFDEPLGHLLAREPHRAREEAAAVLRLRHRVEHALSPSPSSLPGSSASSAAVCAASPSATSSPRCRRAAVAAAARWAAAQRGGRRRRLGRCPPRLAARAARRAGAVLGRARRRSSRLGAPRALRVEPLSVSGVARRVTRKLQYTTGGARVAGHAARFASTDAPPRRASRWAAPGRRHPVARLLGEIGAALGVLFRRRAVEAPPQRRRRQLDEEDG